MLSIKVSFLLSDLLGHLLFDSLDLQVPLFFRIILSMSQVNHFEIEIFHPLVQRGQRILQFAGSLAFSYACSSVSLAEVFNYCFILFNYNLHL